MKIRHLSENEIQLHVTENFKLSQDLLTHLESCAICQTELITYQTLFANIKSLKRPAFDFDLLDLVLKKIPPVKPKFPWVTYLAVLVTILFFVIIFITFSSYLIQVFRALPTIYFFIIATSVFLVLFFQGFEAIKIYREKINHIKIN
jgi:phosphoglycerol transferase MdoB-like AlkP superfamily enzyme